ncbi:polysaccharide biosynthesis tyrosine autokinase [Bizionia argentinensis JUB59]|uniref:non-specific protein-tyrosine kinase n=1 Tax=Bizionia argentinensis JUB59 TaxID=1046627 RepID=G2E9A0_9FLAO|nr:polysaccharide biosynthesis tyrosine autokinase [Bizionia argentinensis]EGV44823.1 polysaccharide biosynthesis tyrosine autokinase [Bizionia argentinensis JUB59]
MKQQTYFKDLIEPYLHRWKFILLCVIAALTLAFVYLRYASNEYQAKATIKIKDDKSQGKLPEISNLQNYGLFSNDQNNVLDEIEIIKSRNLIASVVKDLKFNIQFFVEGRIKAHEVYTNPPLNINFSAPDSLLYTIDTTFNIRINSTKDFIFKGASGYNKALKNNTQKHSDVEGVLYDFGKSIATSFGEIIITPNMGQYATKIGSNITIRIQPINAVTSNYKTKLQIQTTELSSVIKLTINDNVGEKAELFLDKLIDKYNEDVINDKNMVVEATSSFINDRLTGVSRELGIVDLTAEDIQQTNKLTNLSTQSTIFLQTEKENEAKITETGMQLQLIDYMRSHLSDNQNVSDLLPLNMGIQDGAIEQVASRHNSLVQERDRILKNSSEINPTVVNLTTQINQLKTDLAQSLNSKKTTSQITYNSLVAENSRINSQIYSAPQKERQFKDIKRQQDIKESLYLYLLQKREESAITHGVSSPNAKIVDKAYASGKPVAPKWVITILAALILGLSLPIGMIYLLTLIDTKVHTAQDIKKTINVPFIGAIPKAKKRTRLINKFDYSPKAEAFRMVRTNIEFMLKSVEKQSKVIFVTSTTSKEGKSHTAINLALSLSYTEKKVLLIETDIRVPKATNYLNIKNDNGLTNYISDPSLQLQDVIVNLKDNDYLEVIPSGVIPPNPAELLMSKRMQELFDTVNDKYDYIIVDTAAVGLVTDTLLISQHADLFIYVVRANYLDKRRLQIAETMYQEKRLPNMTILLNSVDYKKGNDYGYGYGKNPNKKKWWQRN